MKEETEKRRKEETFTFNRAFVYNVKESEEGNLEKDKILKTQ